MPLWAERSRSTSKAVLCLHALAVLLIVVFITTACMNHTQDIQATCYADIEVQDYGTITIALNEDAAPITVDNFVSLAKNGFYDGLTFYRVIEGFMIQGGDPNADGTGGSGRTIFGEFLANGYENELSHTRGAISMFRTDEDYNSASSQFFIVHQDSVYLDGQYAVFGYVVSGIEIMDTICETVQPSDSNGSVKPDDQPVISTIRIYE